MLNYKYIVKKEMINEKEMIDDINSFIPIYPIIDKSTDIYNDTYKKKEFYDLKLDKIEDIPDIKGKPLKHQELIARFLSSHTMYNELLIFHEMGTGKSCTAVRIAEQSMKDNFGINSALYISRGDTTNNNFINELIFNCTDGRYIPENYNKLTELEKTHRKKKAIKDKYDIGTYQTFAKEIYELNDKAIIEKYSNKVIIIDEIHNIRIQDTVEDNNKIKVYSQFDRFLHLVKNCKIILMSGTPMKDGVEEISSVMNLILPESLKFPNENEFIKEYFESGENFKYIKKGKLEDFKNKIKGRVSYLSSMDSDVKKEFIGKKNKETDKFPVCKDIMSEYQTEGYINAYKEDKKEKSKIKYKSDVERNSGIYSNVRQASLFVFPDGSYGKEGFDKYINKKSKKEFSKNNKKVKSNTYYSLSPELKNIIIGDDGNLSDNEKLENLKIYSSKYAESIKTILDAREEGKCVFVYNEFIQGSGLILFGLILELFGFKHSTGKESTGDEAPRYFSLTSLISSKSIKTLIDRFNQPDNMNGKIINIILGSRKVAEGFTFKNIQVEDIQTPWFNYNETAQVLARGYRLGSHKDLLDSGILPQVDIYHRVSIPQESEISNKLPDGSIDLEMYNISQDKDVSIKSVERILKELAIDCQLNYERNRKYGKDNLRECEYMDCNYKCYGIDEKTDIDLDYSTFDLYYNEDIIKEIIDIIIQFFRTTFSENLETVKIHIKSKNNNYNNFEILTALHKIIDGNIKITNQYGFSSYLKEHNNVLFLIDSLSVISDSFLIDYYTKYPSIKEFISYEKMLNIYSSNNLLPIIKLIENISTLEDVRNIMNRLPIEVQEFFIEASISSRKKIYKKVNVKVRDLILEYFRDFFVKVDDVYISFLLEKEKGILRCLYKNKEKWEDWENCSDDYKKQREQKIKDSELKLEKDNEYGYYGIYNKTENKFKIKKITEDNKVTGESCETVKLPKLYQLVIKELEIEIPSEEELNKIDKKLIKLIKDVKLKKKKEKTKEDLILEITTNKKIDSIYTEGQLKGMSKDNLIRISFFGKIQRKPLCIIIKDWFEKKGLLKIE